MPNREDEFWVNRKEEEQSTVRRTLCYYCGSEDLVYDQNGKLWICQNRGCSRFGIATHYVSGGSIDWRGLIVTRPSWVITDRSDGEIYLPYYNTSGPCELNHSWSIWGEVSFLPKGFLYKVCEKCGRTLRRRIE